MPSKKRRRFDGEGEEGGGDKTCDQSDEDCDGQDFISKRRGGNGGRDKERMYKKESSSSSTDFSRSPSPARNRERAEDRDEQTSTADDPRLRRLLEAGLREKEYQESDEEERRERLDEDSERQRAGSVSDIFQSGSYGAVQSSEQSTNLLADIISSSSIVSHDTGPPSSINLLAEAADLKNCSEMAGSSETDNTNLRVRYILNKTLKDSDGNILSVTKKIVFNQP